MSNEINLTKLWIDKNYAFKGTLTLEDPLFIVNAKLFNTSFKEQDNFIMYGLTDTKEKFSLLNCNSSIMSISKREHVCETSVKIFSNIIIKNYHIHNINELLNCNIKLIYKGISSFISNSKNKLISLKDIDLTFNKINNDEDLEVTLTFKNNFDLFKIHEYIFPINTLLSISSNKFLTPTKISLEKKQNKMEILYKHLKKLKVNDSVVAEHELTLNYTDIVSNSQTLDTWYKIINKFGNILGYMNSYLYEEQLSQISILKLLQALEVYSDNVYYWNKTLKEEDNKKLIDNTNVSYRKKIKNILTRTQYIHKLDEKGIENLAYKLKKQRNYLTHRIFDISISKTFKNDTSYITYFLYTILRSCILMDIGLDKEKIYKTWTQKERIDDFKHKLLDKSL